MFDVDESAQGDTYDASGTQDVNLKIDGVVAETTLGETDGTVDVYDDSTDPGDIAVAKTSCGGRCGTYDANLSCQCDSACQKNDDCCQDYKVLCGAFGGGTGDADIQDTTPTDTGGSVADATLVDSSGDAVGGSCVGRCGTYDSQASCQCDSYCKSASDCCADFSAVCGAPDGTSGGSDGGGGGDGYEDGKVAVDSIGADVVAPDGGVTDGGVLDISAVDSVAADTVPTASDTAAPDQGAPGCTVLTCDDANPCTIDQCDGTSCSHLPQTGAKCDDGQPCTQDACESGKCVGVPVNCDDGDPCTKDSCDSTTDACVNTSIPACGLADLTVVQLKPKTTIFPVYKQVSITYVEKNVGAKTTPPYHNLVIVSSDAGFPKKSTAKVTTVARPALAAGSSRSHTISFKVPGISGALGDDSQDYVC